MAVPAISEIFHWLSLWNGQFLFTHDCCWSPQQKIPMAGWTLHDTIEAICWGWFPMVGPEKIVSSGSALPIKILRDLIYPPFLKVIYGFYSSKLVGFFRKET